MRCSPKKVYLEEKHFIRIRPEERDGKWKIKADVKPREGEYRNQPGATWDIPPMCPDIRKNIQPGLSPTLVSSVLYQNIHTHHTYLRLFVG
jgi:hypothetical protein